MVVPFPWGSMTNGARDGADIARLFAMIQVILFLWMTSASPKASSLKSSSWEASTLEASALKASSSAIEVAIGDLETSSKVPVEGAASASLILWVVGTVFPKVCAIVCPAQLISFLFLPLLLGFFHLLGFGSFFGVLLPIRHLFLLLYEIFDFLF